MANFWYTPVEQAYINPIESNILQPIYSNNSADFNSVKEKIRKNPDEETKKIFLEKLEALKDKHEKEKKWITYETEQELYILQSQATQYSLEKCKVRIEKNIDTNESYINLSLVKNIFDLHNALKVIKSDYNLLKTLQENLFNIKTQKDILENSALYENIDFIIASIYTNTCPTDTNRLKNIKLKIEWIQNYEKSKEIILNKVPKDKKGKISKEIDWFFETSSKWKTICSHSIINWISDLLKENWVTKISDEEIKDILQTWVESQLIKEEIVVNVRLEEAAKSIGLDSNNLSKEDKEKVIKALSSENKEKLEILEKKKEKNEIIQNLTTDNVYKALHTDEKTYKEDLRLWNTLKEIEEYVLSKHDMDLRSLNAYNNLENTLKLLKNNKNKSNKDKELIVILESYIKLLNDKKRNDNEIDKQIIASESVKKEEKQILSKSNIDYIVPSEWKPSFINIEWTSDKISITKVWEKFIVKIGESSEECNNEEELNNVVKAWKILVENWLSCIIWDIKNIMNILSKKFQFNFDAKDWMDSEETKLFFSGILHTLWEWDFNELKNMQKDEIFEKFKSFRYKNVTMLSKFQKSWIIWKENNKFSIYAFEDKLKWIDSSKI